MNKRTKKILIIISIILIIYLLIPFCKNPVSDFITRREVENYLQENYPGMGYEIISSGFNFLESHYRYTVAIPGSKDDHFDIHIKKYGGIYLDGYKTAQKFNIYEAQINAAQRLYTEYDRIVESALDINEILSDGSHGTVYGTFEFATRKEYEEHNDIPVYAYFYDDLVADKEYDVKEMGRDHGRVIISVQHEENISYRRVAEIILWAKEKLEDADIGCYCIYVSISSPPSGEDGSAQYMDPYIAVNDLPYTEITEENLVKKVEENYKAYLESTGDPLTYLGEE
ncbi:MAG: hypothetical protein IKM61_01635 [Eubacteriaceae bacterium]|nr:hypothetical protein [Eubacteriaceae bacterium]